MPFRSNPSYEKYWDEGYEDGCAGNVQKALDIGARLSTVSMPELYYFRGNVVGQLNYIKQKIASDYTPIVDPNTDALRPEDV